MNNYRLKKIICLLFEQGPLLVSDADSLLSRPELAFGPHLPQQALSAIPSLHSSVLWLCVQATALKEAKIRHLEASWDRTLHCLELLR